MDTCCAHRCRLGRGRTSVEVLVWRAVDRPGTATDKHGLHTAPGWQAPACGIRQTGPMAFRVTGNVESTSDEQQNEGSSAASDDLPRTAFIVRLSTHHGRRHRRDLASRLQRVVPPPCRPGAQRNPALAEPSRLSGARPGQWRLVPHRSGGTVSEVNLTASWTTTPSQRTSTE